LRSLKFNLGQTSSETMSCFWLISRHLQSRGGFEVKMLNLVGNTSAALIASHDSAGSTEGLDHHCGLIESYLQSHRIRNHSERTIHRDRAFLKGWFEEYGTLARPLYTWEAMAPQSGRERIVQYGQGLIEGQLSSDTVRSYLGILRNYFSFILEHPFLKTSSGFIRIQNFYGPIDQPISEYDIPTHAYDGERKGVPFDPERLYEFYSLVRKNYLEIAGHAKAIAARNYTALVISGESGLRADELLHLGVQDLHFDSLKIQTRFAKGTRGSGKRARLTLFTPLAQDTARFYLQQYRPKIYGSDQSSFLFPSKTGGLLDYSNLQKGLAEMIQAAEKAGFSVASHMSWHWMRRFFATRFIERFPNKLSILITLLGHQNSGTVHRYIRHSQAWMDEQIQETLQGVKQWPSIGD
jgi:integrase